MNDLEKLIVSEEQMVKELVSECFSMSFYGIMKKDYYLMVAGLILAEEEIGSYTPYLKKETFDELCESYYMITDLYKHYHEYGFEDITFA